MSDSGDQFARRASGVYSAQLVRQDELFYLYHGQLDGEEQTVRFLTLAPDITDEAVHEAFMRATGQWQNPSSHPNIVTLFERGETPRPWIAIEIIDGNPLDTFQDELSLPQVQQVIADVSEAIRNAHLYNTVHHALEPAHVWIHQSAEDVTALVGDWGLERNVRIATGDRPITAFTAPELLDDPKGGTEETDIYGLGIIAYYAVTGQLPVSGADIEAVLREGDVTPPSEVASGVPAKVDDVVLTALAHDPSDRYQSVHTFQTAITDALSDVSTEAVTGDREESSGAATDEFDVEDQSESSGAPGEAEQQSDENRSVLTRRTALTVLGIGAAGITGWYLGRSTTNSDPSSSVTGPPQTARLTAWLPPSTETVGRPAAPFYTLRPSRLDAHRSRIPANVYPFFTQSIPENLLVFDELEAALIGPAIQVYQGISNESQLRTTVQEWYNVEQGVTDGSYTRYSSDGGGGAVALGNGTLVIAQQTLKASGKAILNRALAAKRGNRPRYSEVRSGVQQLVNALSDRAFARIVPIVDTPADKPAKGLFPSEVGYGLGLQFQEETMTLEYTRAFASEAPTSGLETWLETGPYTGPTEATLSSNGSIATAAGQIPIGALTLGHLAGQCRDVASEVLSRGPGVRQTEAQTYRGVVYARQFSFAGFDLPAESSGIPVGSTVTLHVTSQDVCHGVSINQTKQRLLVPGEVETVTIQPQSRGHITLSCTRYCGRGHKAMQNRLPVYDPAYRSYGGWLSNYTSYDGSPVDKTGQDRITIMVGASGNGGNFAFDPPAVKVSPGTTVAWEWTGKGGAHNIVAKNGAFKSAIYSSQGVHFEYTFTEPGIYKYACQPHKALGEKGIVEVPSATNG